MKRVNIRVSEELHSYYKQESEKTGLSVTSLMVLALNKFMNEDKQLKIMPDLLKALEDLKEEQLGDK